MRITLADPPAYTPAYDHALAAALARQGADVRLLTSRFRYGAVPAASGYVLDDSLYRVSSRIGSRARRLAAKGARASSRALPGTRSRTATSSTCSGLRRRTQTPGSCTRARPLVFTAHDLLPRRTARHTRTWKRLFGRFDRIVTHSERGRRALSLRSACPTRSCASSRTRPSAASPSARTTVAPSSRSA